jgi:hypothetical protein
VKDGFKKVLFISLKICLFADICILLVGLYLMGCFNFSLVKSTLHEYLGNTFVYAACHPAGSSVNSIKKHA